MDYATRTVAEWMEATGTTQADIAALLRVTPAAVSMWFSGQREPRVKHLRKLSALSGVPMERIVFPKSKRRAA